MLVSSLPPIAQAPPIPRPRARPWRLAAATEPRAAGTGLPGLQAQALAVRAQIVPREPMAPLEDSWEEELPPPAGAAPLPQR